MSEYDNNYQSCPLFVVTRHYMRMVMEMFSFIKAVRTGNWLLHLSSLELFAKYFFAHDRINYARMIPVYLSEMASLKDEDPSLHEEFISGNWVVNKNQQVSFCAVGGDNALEHLNRSMKVSVGLVRIALNLSARAKFFLIAPELAKLATEARSMAGFAASEQKHHHDLTPAITKSENEAINNLTQTIQSYTGPFLHIDNDTTNTR